MTKRIPVYVVATSQKEAESVADMIGHKDKADAVDHLAEVKAPPTDPHYADQYRIYTVYRETEC